MGEAKKQTFLSAETVEGESMKELETVTCPTVSDNGIGKFKRMKCDTCETEQQKCKSLFSPVIGECRSRHRHGPKVYTCEERCKTNMDCRGRLCYTESYNKEDLAGRYIKTFGI